MYRYVAQSAYGTDTYNGTQAYGCQTNCTTTSEGAPNTGFLGLGSASPDAVLATAGGALLVAVGVVGVVMVIISRVKRNKQPKAE